MKFSPPPTDTDPDNPVTDDPVLPNDDITNPIPETNNGFTVDPPIYRNNSVFNRDLNDLGDFNAFYEQDGYATPTVIRMDVRVDNLIQGVCIEDDPSGCTLEDVLADVDRNDGFDVEIAVHASGEGLPDDGTITNATLRQRGNFSRSGEQKSFRLRLRGDDNLWRNEDRLQLNKHPFDFTRFKNKLSFDLFRSVPHLPSLRTQFVNLWIDNGQGLEDYGVFTHVEHVGRQYVANRRLGENDNLYKTEFFQFSQIDLDKVRVDAEGNPLDDDKFADALDIENGNDHSALTSMLEAMADPERSFESILDEHFNRNNVLTWLATNLILRQADAITKNYYLYNPAGTERFYFLPWDYDGAFESEAELRNSFNNTDLAKRKFYGYARGGNNEFISRFYRMPGAHNLLVSTIVELREHYYSDEQILSLASSLQEVLRPHLSSLPDSEHLTFEETAPLRMVTVININHDDIINNYTLEVIKDDAKVKAIVSTIKVIVKSQSTLLAESILSFCHNITTIIISSESRKSHSGRSEIS